MPCLPGDGHDRVHVRGMAGDVDRDDGLGPVADGRLEAGRVEVRRLGVEVGVDDRRALMMSGDRGGEKRGGGHHHLVARADAPGLEASSIETVPLATAAPYWQSQ